MQKEEDSTITIFDWAPNETSRTEAFFNLLIACLDLPLGMYLRDVHGTNVFSHKLEANSEVEKNLLITEKTDGLITVKVPINLPISRLPIESIFAIELKTHDAITEQQSFRSAVTQLILLSLISQYRVQQVLTCGDVYYFLSLVKVGNAYQIQYEYFDDRCAGIARLRYLLHNFIPESSEELQSHFEFTRRRTIDESNNNIQDDLENDIEFTVGNSIVNESADNELVSESLSLNDGIELPDKNIIRKYRKALQQTEFLLSMLPIGQTSTVH
jgi:hypothetical protein